MQAIVEESLRGEAVSMERTLFLDRHLLGFWAAQGVVGSSRSSFIQFIKVSVFDLRSRIASQGNDLKSFCYEMGRAHHDR